jgi:hypothetical protein
LKSGDARGALAPDGGKGKNVQEDNSEVIVVLLNLYNDINEITNTFYHV